MAVSLDVLPDNILKISLQAIGVAISKSSDFPFTCNFLATGEALVTEEVVKIPIGENVYEVTPSMAMIMSAAVAIVLGILVAIPIFVLPQIQAKNKLSLMN